MGSTLIFQFLYMHVLNHRYFHTHYIQRFLSKKTFKEPKNFKTRF